MGKEGKSEEEREEGDVEEGKRRDRDGGEGRKEEGKGGSHLPLEALEIPCSCSPRLCLALRQPWARVRGVRWRGKRGRAQTAVGQARHPPHTPPGNSSPCKRFQACSPLRKPHMPKSTHTKQTHQGGSCTIKGFFALREGSAHGKLKIGASPGAVKEALISEAPPHTMLPAHPESWRYPRGWQGWGCLKALTSARAPPRPTFVLCAADHESPQGGGVHSPGDRLAAVLLCRGILGHLDRTWEATTHHSWQGSQQPRERTEVHGHQVSLQWGQGRSPCPKPSSCSLLPSIMPERETSSVLWKRGSS